MRYILLDLSIQEKRFTLVCLYGLNSDDPDFFSTLHADLEMFENNSIITVGGWNVVRNPELDTFGYRTLVNPGAKEAIDLMCSDLNLIDVWRTRNENKSRYTWRRKNPTLIQSRLDYFLVSPDFASMTERCQICPGYRTDHSAIVFSFSIMNVKRGKGFWKLNTSLLRDPNYVNLVNETISILF